MSDFQRPGFQEAVTLDDLQNEAGRVEPMTNADVDRLSEQCATFIGRLNDNHGATMAKTKLAEMIFWIKASRSATRL